MDKPKTGESEQLVGQVRSCIVRLYEDIDLNRESFTYRSDSGHIEATSGIQYRRASVWDMRRMCQRYGVSFALNVYENTQVQGVYTIDGVLDMWFEAPAEGYGSPLGEVDGDLCLYSDSAHAPLLTIFDAGGIEKFIERVGPDGVMRFDNLTTELLEAIGSDNGNGDTAD